MNIGDQNLKLSQWISGEGPQQDIVLSNRIRLARNLEKTAFPGRAGREELSKISKKIRETKEVENKNNLKYIEVNNISPVERKILVEKNLTSPFHLQNHPEAGLLINEEENICIMINEEDHIRIQVLTAGFQLNSSWEKADKIDDNLEKDLDFAFSKKLGYLSACPTNLGTGLRASVMVHLPALNFTNNINQLLGAVSQLGLVVRGIYGEGSESAGNIYQISNQVTLGNSELDIIDNLKDVTLQIIEEERNTRKRLLSERKNYVTDRIMRAYGILRYARKISGEEAMELISQVKMGIDMGVIDSLDTKMLSELMILIRPAHLQKRFAFEPGEQKEEIKRASLIRERMKQSS